MSLQRKRLLTFSPLVIFSSITGSIFSLPMGSRFFFSPPYSPRDTDQDQKLSFMESQRVSIIRSTLRSSKEPSHRIGYLASMWIRISFSKSLVFIDRHL